MIRKNQRPESIRKSHSGRRFRFFLSLIAIFLVVSLGTVFGVQFVTKTGVFKVPGKVIYDASLSDDEIETLSNIFTEDIELNKDVTISAENYLEKPDLKDGEFITEIYVAVTDFYSSETNLTAESVEELYSNAANAEVSSNTDAEAISYQIISIDDLDNTKKLLEINDSYYLTDFTSGAIFRVIKFASEKYDEEIAPLIEGIYAKSFPEKNTVLSFAETGVTALSRGMNEKLAEVGNATYFSEYIAEYLSSFDLTHTSNESSFTALATSDNICSDTRFIDTLLDIGLDIVELTGNHNEDCGDEAAIDSIDIYNTNGIKIVGGGKTASEAAEPLEISEKNTNITMFAYNLSTGGATTDNTPGANQYYEESAAREISEAKANGQFLIVDVQYYECNSYDSETEDTTCDYADSAAGDQVGFFRHLIDLGADVIVGTSAHQTQTFELYGDGVIYYGLGNLFFDQVWWPGTTRSLILEHYFYNGKLLQTRLTPTVYDNNMQTKLMDEDTAKWFIERLVSARP